MTPETSARQCWHWLAATSRRRVGFGCNGRCAPACGLAFGFASATPLALCPCEGGVLELSGVFGGKSSLRRSSKFSFRNAAFSTSKTSERADRSFSRSINVKISASFAALSRRAKSGGGIIHRLTHIRRRNATAFLPFESICRTALFYPHAFRGVSNYPASDLALINPMPTKLFLNLGARQT